MKFINDYNNRLSMIYLLLAIGLFITANIYYIPFYVIVIKLFEFIIFLEVVRMVGDFIFKDIHAIKVRYAIDSFILLFSRDLVVVFSNFKTENWTQIGMDTIKVFLLLLITFSFFKFRQYALKYSPSDKDCEICSSIKDCDIHEMSLKNFKDKLYSKK